MPRIADWSAPRWQVIGLAVVLLSVGLPLAAALLADNADKAKPAVAINTSLPILWGQHGEPTAPSRAAHISRTREHLEQDWRLEPIDTLVSLADGELAPGVPVPPRLLLAQPRPLSPAENVALDDWVRAGGSLLLFADPMLTQHSHWPLGDPRRPQDVALLSPILARWGLALRYEPEPAEGAAPIKWNGETIPQREAGRFASIEPAGGAPASCSIEAAGLIANCRIGSGHALVVADAHLLDEDEIDPPALDTLLENAFPR